MRTGLGNPLFDRKKETVKVDGDKFIYSCIINRYHKKDETQKLTITIQKVSNSKKILDDDNSTFSIATKEQFLTVFDSTSKNVIEIFKHYKSLINGKRSYKYTMAIELN
jgi:predicted double-glycine peptidase